MRRNEILRSIMVQKDMCIADIARLTEIPYSTIKSIMENNVEKSSYGNICAICSALGITTDDLERLADVTARDPETEKFFDLNIHDFSEEEMTQLKHYIDYLRYLRGR